MATVVKPRICRRCGAVFDGSPHAWYYPARRLAQSREADARKRRKGRKTDRPLSNIDKRTVYGKEYVVKSGRQEYYPDYTHEAVRAMGHLASRAWNQANKEACYPTRNEKRRRERAESPGLVRAREWAAHAKQKSRG